MQFSLFYFIMVGVSLLAPFFWLVPPTLTSSSSFFFRLYFNALQSFGSLANLLLNRHIACRVGSTLSFLIAIPIEKPMRRSVNRVLDSKLLS